MEKKGGNFFNISNITCQKSRSFKNKSLSVGVKNNDHGTKNGKEDNELIKNTEDNLEDVEN